MLDSSWVVWYKNHYFRWDMKNCSTLNRYFQVDILQKSTVFNRKNQKSIPHTYYFGHNCILDEQTIEWNWNCPSAPQLDRFDLNESHSKHHFISARSISSFIYHSQMVDSCTRILCTTCTIMHLFNFQSFFNCFYFVRLKSSLFIALKLICCRVDRHLCGRLFRSHNIDSSKSPLEIYNLLWSMQFHNMFICEKIACASYRIDSW